MDIEEIVQAIQRPAGGSALEEKYHDQANRLLRLATKDEDLWLDIFTYLTISLKQTRPTPNVENQSLEKDSSPPAAGAVVSSLGDEGTPQVLETTNRPDEGPHVNSFRDLHTLCEAFDKEDGQRVSSYSTFSFIDDTDIAYFGQVNITNKDLSLQDVKEALKRVPDEEIYPELTPHITTVSTPLKGDVYIKRPKLINYDELKDTGLLPKMLLDEAETLELLMQTPHPNIVRYHGCVVKRGRITGIVLDRLLTTLKDRLKDGAQDFNKDSCLVKITSAVEHLHSLGLAHNDLNPANIMLDEHDMPVVIDLGSCQPFGKVLISAGTRGWIDEDFATSEQRHDEIALGKLRAWVEKMTAS